MSVVRVALASAARGVHASLLAARSLAAPATSRSLYGSLHPVASRFAPRVRPAVWLLRQQRAIATRPRLLLAAETGDPAAEDPEEEAEAVVRRLLRAAPFDALPPLEPYRHG